MIIEMELGDKQFKKEYDSNIKELRDKTQELIKENSLISPIIFAQIFSLINSLISYKETEESFFKGYEDKEVVDKVCTIIQVFVNEDTSKISMEDLLNLGDDYLAKYTGKKDNIDIDMMFR